MKCAWISALIVSLLTIGHSVPVEADIDSTNTFTYSSIGDVDGSLGLIALYLKQQNRREGATYVSREVESGIVGYQLKYFDDGNGDVDNADWFSVKRYRIPAEPDTLKPVGYYKSDYIELVDLGLDGLDAKDYYFIKGRRFDLRGQTEEVLRQYQVQIESGVTAFLQKITAAKVADAIGSKAQTGIKKTQSYDDGSLPARLVFGLDMGYVFKPIERSGNKLSEKEMIEEIRQRVGFVFSAAVEYTDLNGYRFREVADQTALLQRTYDPVEKIILKLVIDALFDTDGDGVITSDNISNGYTRFREIHQQLIEQARAKNQRIVLPTDKLFQLREEYQALHGQAYKIPN
ncbi:MAG: hypothetical protein ACO36I_09545 [Candidatus Latescibacterota bacterium]|jgi:hypothetical protein